MPTVPIMIHFCVISKTVCFFTGIEIYLYICAPETKTPIKIGKHSDSTKPKQQIITLACCLLMQTVLKLRNQVSLGCLHTTSGAATGDNKVFRYSYIKTLYLTHNERSGASGDERS